MAPENPKFFKIGIIRGEGTGNRLADIFIEFLNRIVKNENARRQQAKIPLMEVEFAEDMEKGEIYTYHSYSSLINLAENLAKRDPPEKIDFQKVSAGQALRLRKLLEKWHQEGIRTVFRTSINAEALYLYRQEVKAAKEIAFETPAGGQVLIIRDQAEGFYANAKYVYHAEEEEEIISFSGKYSRSHQHQVVKHALEAARRLFKEETFKQLAIYKFHLFGNYLERWINEEGKKIIAYQPDNGLTELIQFINTGIFGGKEVQNLLVICSNEVGDLIQESVMSSINFHKPKIELYTKNVYLASNFKGEEQLTEYQTIHGSADDLVGDEEEKLNPIATFRIAADIAENVLGIEGVREKMEDAIVYSKMNNLTTTSEILSCVHSRFQ